MTWKSRAIHILVVVVIVVLTNLYRDALRDIESFGCNFQSWGNFIHIIVIFLFMQIFGIGESGKLNLLVIYLLMLINLPLQFLLVTEGSFLAKFFFLTLGALVIWFFYIPYFDISTQTKSNEN
jgi:hypothetical protein